jgi:hypothetical protein
MGDTPDRGEERLDETPPFPFMEDLEPSGPPAPAAKEPGPDPEPEDWEPPSREQWEAERARIAAAEENAKASREQVEQSNTLMREMLGAQRPIPPDPEPEDPGEMPDPARDPKEFATWLNKRDRIAETRINRNLQTFQSEVQQTTRANDLFAQFIAKYPHMADKRAYIETAAREAGLRPTDPKEKIFEKVTDELKRLGVDVEPQAKEDPSPRTRGDGGRTAGLGGGSGARRRRRAEKEEEVKDLVDQVAEEQVRLGIY